MACRLYPVRTGGKLTESELLVASLGHLDASHGPLVEQAGLEDGEWVEAIITQAGALPRLLEGDLLHQLLRGLHHRDIGLPILNPVKD